MNQPDEGVQEGSRWFTPGVGGVGAASFFSDAGHEMTTSVLPTLVTSTLHAGPGALGAIVGPLLVSLLVGVIGISRTILLSFIPGILAAAAITLASREAPGYP